MAKTNKGRLLIFILYGTMFLFGFLENIKGVSYPLIKNEYHVSYETQGKMISSLSFCYTLFVVISGFVLSRFGTKIVYLMGLACAFLGVFSIYFMPGFWAAAFSLLLVFAGFGIFEIGINGVASRLFTEKTALMLNILHFMYGLGAIIGPKAAGMLADSAGPGLGWRQIYLLTSPLVLVILVPAVFTKFPGVEGGVNEAPRGEGHGFIAALKTPMVWFFGLTLGLMMGLEMASANWGGLYFQDVYGMDPATRGANFVSAFYILFTLSRLVSGFLIEKAGYMRSLMGAALVVMAVFIAGFVLGERGIYVLPALGFFMAVFWPTLMAVAIRFFGNNAPVTCSAIIAMGGLVNAGIQLGTGYINRWIGAEWGYRSCLVFVLILFCALLGLNRAAQKKTAGVSPGNARGE
jgi:fucose permease